MKLSRLGYITGRQSLRYHESPRGTNIDLLGVLIALIVFVALNWLFPPRGVGEGTDRHDEDTLVLPSAYRQDIPSQGQYSGLTEVEVASDISTDGVATNEPKKDC